MLYSPDGWLSMRLCMQFLSVICICSILLISHYKICERELESGLELWLVLWPGVTRWVWQTECTQSDPLHQNPMTGRPVLTFKHCCKAHRQTVSSCVCWWRLRELDRRDTRGRKTWLDCVGEHGEFWPVPWVVEEVNWLTRFTWKMAVLNGCMCVSVVMLISDVWHSVAHHIWSVCSCSLA